MKKRPYLYEIPIFFALVCGVNYIFAPHMPGFMTVEPHPYWLGVVLFGFRYGITAGAASGLIAATLYLSAAWFFGERYPFHDVSFYFQPGLFVIVGVLIGVGIYRYRSRIRKLEDDKVFAGNQEKIFRDELKTLREINKGLEKKAVSKMSTLITLYEGARRLESVKLESLYPAILDFIVKTLEAEQAALYLRKPTGWELCVSHGWREYEKRPTTLDFNQGITGMAGMGGRIVSIRDFVGQGEVAPQYMGDCLFAGPLKRGQSGEVVGVVSVQAMAFMNFNSSTMNLFSFLLEWASRSVDMASYVQNLQSNEIVDSEFQVFSTRYFESRLGQEFSRSQTYYLPLSLFLISCRGLSVLDGEKRRRVMTVLSEFLKRHLREMDVIARYPQPDVPFGVLLITVSEAKARELARQIQEDFDKMGLGKGWTHPLTLKVGVASFTPQSGNTQAMIEQALKEL